MSEIKHNNEVSDAQREDVRDEDIFCIWLGHNFFEFVIDIKGNDWMGADVGPEVWGKFRKAYRIQEILDKTEIKASNDVMLKSGGRLVPKSAVKNPIFKLCNSWETVNEADINLKYWLGRLLFEYVREGNDNNSKTVHEVEEFLKSYNFKYTVQDVCDNAFSSLRIDEHGRVIIHRLTVTGDANIAVDAGSPDQKLQTNPSFDLNNSFSNAAEDNNDDGVFSMWLGHRFFEFAKSVKGKDWMGADFGPDLWGRFRSSYAEVGDFLAQRTQIKMTTVISGSRGRLAPHPTRTNIYTLCSSMAFTLIQLENNNEENVIDLQYWLGHLLYEYVKEGPGRSRTETEVVEFLERNNSIFLVQDVCTKSFGWLEIHDNIVTALELYAPSPAPAPTPIIQYRPGVADRPGVVAPVTMIEYWAGHLFMEYINEQPKKILKDENLGYFTYRYRTLPKQRVLHLVRDSGKRLFASKGVQGFKYRLGPGPFEDLTAKSWLGRAVFEYVFAAPQRKRSEQDVVERFAGSLTSDSLNNLCWSSLNWLIKIRKSGGGVDIQCGNGDAAYRLRIVRESNRSTGTDIHALDVSLGGLDVDQHEQDGVSRGKYWTQAALELTLIKLIVDIYSDPDSADRKNILKFLNTTQSVLLWLLFIAAINLLAAGVGYITPFFKDETSTRILSTVSLVVALYTTWIETWIELEEQHEDDESTAATTTTTADEQHVEQAAASDADRKKEVIAIFKFVLLTIFLMNSFHSRPQLVTTWTGWWICSALAWIFGCFIALTESRVDDIWMRALMMGCTFYAHIWLRHDSEALFSFLVPLAHDLFPKSERERKEFLRQIIGLFLISFFVLSYFTLLVLLLMQVFISYLATEYSYLTWQLLLQAPQSFLSLIALVQSWVKKLANFVNAWLPIRKEKND